MANQKSVKAHKLSTRKLIQSEQKENRHFVASNGIRVKFVFSERDDALLIDDALEKILTRREP